MTGPGLRVSGGDLHALRLLTAWERRSPGSVGIVAPRSALACSPVDFGRLLVRGASPLDRWSGSPAVYFVNLVVRTFWVLASPASRVSIAASHFFHDVIPCVARHVFRGSCLVAYVHHVIARSDRRGRLVSRLAVVLERVSLALLRRFATLVFVGSPEVGDQLTAMGFAPARVVVTTNSCDPLVPFPARREPSEPALLFCARLVEEKGVWDMLEVCARLARRFPAVRVTMVGDGVLRDRVASEAARRGLDNLALPGFVSEDRKWQLLRSSTLFLSPSHEEGWGIAVCEALRAGTPAVVYDLPAYAHLGDGVIRVPARDAAAFADAVLSLLADGAALGEGRRRAEATAAALPTWDEVLTREIDEVRARCPTLEGGAPR